MVLRQSFDNPIARRFTHMANQKHDSDSSSSSEFSESEVQDTIERVEAKEPAIIEEEASEYMNTQEEILDEQIEEQKCIRSMTKIIILFMWALSTVSLIT